MDNQIPGVHPQAERNGVEFAEFDTPARRFFERRDDPAAHTLLKRVSSHPPAQQPHRNHAKCNEPEKQLEKDAAAHWRCRLLTQRFCSPDLESGVLMWPSERRLVSHPVNNSFSFC